MAAFRRLGSRNRADRLQLPGLLQRLQSGRRNEKPGKEHPTRDFHLNPRHHRPLPRDADEHPGRDSLAGGRGIEIHRQHVYRAALRKPVGHGRHRSDSGHGDWIRVRSDAGLFARAVRRGCGREFPVRVRARASDQALPVRVTARAGRRGSGVLPRAKPGTSDSLHPGDALHHPIYRSGRWARAAPAALGQRAASVQDVAVPRAGDDCDCRLGVSFRGHGRKTDAGLARRGGGRYRCIFGTRPMGAPVAIPGDRLMREGTVLGALKLIAIALACSAVVSEAPAQSLPDTVQAINKARVTTRILYVTAHPDDETAALLAYLSRGLYADVALLTITRGQGGQNAIGPEQDAPLGVVRTTELLAADSHYGTHQFFTRAVDPGFSKTPERTMKIWGDQIPLEDMVRVIRTYRPQVVINGWGGVRFGHGQHQASGLLTPKAIADAADPTKFPEQIAEGLPAWKVSLELRPGSFGFGPATTSTAPGGVTLPVNDVSPLWGQRSVEMGMEGHA